MTGSTVVVSRAAGVAGTSVVSQEACVAGERTG